MYIALLFLSAQLALLTAADSVNGGITASNDGIVVPGKSLTLSYKTNSNWTVCIWYRHDTPMDQGEHCMFIRVRGQLLKTCSTESFEDHIEIDGKAALSCDIRIPEVNEADNATWSVRVDAGLTTNDINVTVAVEAKNITFIADPLVAGQYGTVSCQVSGSRPAPLVSHSFKEMSGVASPEVNSTMIQSVDDKGLFVSKDVVVIKPTAYDHNREVSCKAVQKVDDELLFEPSVATSKLSVAFPPLTRHDGQGSEEKPFVFGNQIGKDLEVVIAFLANPRPDSAVWEFAKMTDTSETDGGESKVTVLAGTVSDRYEASDLVNGSDILYESKLTIKNLEEADKDIKYRLVVNNSVGSNTYNFKVVLHEVNTTITMPSLAFPPVKEKGVSTSVILAVTFLCLLILLLAVGFVFCRLCHKRGSETAPLMSPSS